MSRFPFPRYPNGWFQVATSAELTPAAVLPLKYFGRDLVLFRTEAGVPALLDAHCPHLGAHLGHGGTVHGDCIRCPFHAWKFDGDGTCREVPYAKKIPPRAKIATWHLREVNGLIMAWHHLEGLPPQWEMPVIAEAGAEDWAPYETRRWKIRTHNQEMAENAVDSAHFHYVHGTVEQPESHAEVDGHILRVRSSTKMRTPMGKVTGQVESHSYGFGFSVTRFTGIVETLLLAGVTPIDDEYVDVRFAFTVKNCIDRDVTSTVGEHFIKEIERQLGQDIPIWENKIYVAPPALCDGDGPIGVFRKWCRQFYGEPQKLEAPPVPKMFTPDTPASA
jgi:phenylpropionate dioxygenase-like ring-hydroxylating dioxygenase large terminal subunit